MAQTITSNTGQQLFVDTDISKIFIWDNRFDPGTLRNASGAPATIVAGTLLGRISATDKIVPWTAAAADGSQNIMGILNETKTLIPAASEIPCYYCVSGDVDPALLVFTDASTLETVIAGQRVKDILTAKGFKLNPKTDLTKFDNS